MTDRDIILERLKLFSLAGDGIGSWITNDTDPDIFARLGQIDEDPLTKVQLNQLLVLGHEAPVSDGFFEYYWLTYPEKHPYELCNLDFPYDQVWGEHDRIMSLDHLAWGLHRLFVDGLIWFGNVRTAYRFLRRRDINDLKKFFSDRRFDTELIKHRGLHLDLSPIARDDRYLISEMACKSYGQNSEISDGLLKTLIESFRNHLNKNHRSARIGDLLTNDNIPENSEKRQKEFIFSMDDVLEDTVHSEQEIRDKYAKIHKKFISARNIALKNTKLYLSMVDELDVYVATSMRTRQNFREMAQNVDDIFSSAKLQDLNLRYFDPTLSAAEGHEDKGIIECLMVKCAKVLVYFAGQRDSYGKDAEAAMALSLGKPVIFYCDEEQRESFYRDVHPLSRLIEFETGVVVGAIVASSLEEVSDLLFRIFENKMEYKLEKSESGYLRLKERLTGSVVRLQTNDTMLSETFWNHYHNK